MELTYHGHSFFEIGSGGATALVDPFLDSNPFCSHSPEEFDADVVAVTHAHFDHAGDAHLFDAPALGQPEVAAYLESQGHDYAVGFNVGGTVERGGFAFTMLQAFHSSGARVEDGLDAYGGTPASYVVDDGVTRFYHAGDTGLFGDMRSVVAEVYEPDVAAVPIGDHFTMGPEEAATAVDWLDVDVALPMHYGTFPPIEQDPEEFADEVDSADVLVPEPGQTVEV